MYRVSYLSGVQSDSEGVKPKRTVKLVYRMLSRRP